jgi:rod shape-determining protein MreC
MRTVFTRLVVVLGVLVLLGVWATSAGRDLARGVASGMTTPFSRLWNGFTERLWVSAATWVGKGPDERLRQEQADLAHLRLAASEAEELRRQNQDLRAYYGLPPRKGWRVLLGEVIARDPVTWNRGFRIDRGSHDGVLPGCVVMADAYVIGRVVEVQAGSSTVLSVAARGCRLSVVLEGSKNTGILEGGGVGRWLLAPECVVDYLPRETVVAAGELVWTSGLGGSVPGGLVVGRVVPRPDEDAPVLETVQGTHGRVWIAPLASFGRLGVVAVYCPDDPIGKL